MCCPSKRSQEALGSHIDPVFNSFRICSSASFEWDSCWAEYWTPVALQRTRDSTYLAGIALAIDICTGVHSLLRNCYPCYLSCNERVDLTQVQIPYIKISFCGFGDYVHCCTIVDFNRFCCVSLCEEKLWHCWTLVLGMLSEWKVCTFWFCGFIACIY